MFRSCFAPSSQSSGHIASCKFRCLCYTLVAQGYIHAKYDQCMSVEHVFASSLSAQGAKLRTHSYSVLAYRQPSVGSVCIHGRRTVATPVSRSEVGLREMRGLRSPGHSVTIVSSSLTIFNGRPGHRNSCWLHLRAGEVAAQDEEDSGGATRRRERSRRSEMNCISVRFVAPSSRRRRSKHMRRAARRLLAMLRWIQTWIGLWR